jgi:nucleoside-diphosphate-sugar epimerase
MPDLTRIETEADLEEMLSEPTPGVVESMRRLRGDLVLLGVGGKMGLSLARMARRASDAAGVTRRVIGVSRFASGGEDAFRAHGVETVGCNLLDADAVARLPSAENVVLMAGMKFGTALDTPTTWATNSYMPGVVCRRYRDSRVVAFSTGNVYGLVPVAGGGSREDDVPQPVGEYAMSCLGRERIIQFFSKSHGMPAAIIRLNYACELRYGVLVDLARRIWDGETVDLGMGYFNTIWQGDANAMTLRAFDHVASPPRAINVTGPEVLSVRTTCEALGRLLDRPVRFTGQETATALLSDARPDLRTLGPVRVKSDALMAAVARWVASGGRSLGKPTHFEARGGEY